MHDEEIFNLLQKLGLTRIQTRVFLTLVRFHELTGTEIAKHSGVSRPEVYRALGKLQNLGLISMKLKSPRSFSLSVPPKEALEILLLKFEDKIKNLRVEVDKILPKIKKLSENYTVKAQIEKETTATILASPKQVINTVIRLWFEAKKSIDASLYWNEIKNIPETMFKDIIVKKAKNLNVRIIGEVDSENIAEAKWLSKYVNIHYLSWNPLRAMLVNGEKLLVDASEGGKMRPRSEKLEVIFLVGGPWVKIAEKIFNYVWETTKSLEEFKV